MTRNLSPSPSVTSLSRLCIKIVDVTSYIRTREKKKKKKKKKKKYNKLESIRRKVSKRESNLKKL
ncbi:hypothetical protein QG37_05904 [Candidozyma auris]|nr:hypothetical protein QG37_05904 [[Candida] auris]